MIYRITEQHCRTVWNTVSLLINNAILSYGNLAAAAVINQSDWTSEEIREHADEILSFQKPFDEEEIKKCFLKERLIMLDVCQRFFVSLKELANPKDFWHWVELKLMQTTFRRGYMMAEVNRLFDEKEQRFFSGLPEPVRKETHIGDVIMFLIWHGKYVGIPSGLGRLMGNLGFFPDKLQPVLSTRQTNCSLLQLEIALESYRRDHTGKFPDKLDDLRDGYLAEIPLDPFSGKPFQYVVEPASILFYSVGVNGIDEDGRDESDTPKGDDIRRRLGQ